MKSKANAGRKVRENPVSHKHNQNMMTRRSVRMPSQAPMNDFEREANKAPMNSDSAMSPSTKSNR